MNLLEAERIANEKLWEHQLYGWTFKFDNAKRRFGQCNYRRRTISLSRPLTLANERSEVLDTILHEIAHALEWKRHRSAGHGPKWKAICVEIGAKPERCYSSDEVNEIESPYALICESLYCDNEVSRHRKTKTRYLCGKCRSKMILIDRKTLEPVYQPTKKKPTVPDSPYALKCKNPACGNIHPRHRRTRTPYSCGECGTWMDLIETTTGSSVYGY